jgi:hypothetical protein
LAKAKSVEDELQQSLSRWQYLYQHGCTDPFWPDGVNLNLVRNHVIYFKNKIEEARPCGKYPAIYYQATPPEVDNNYVVEAGQMSLF